MQASGFLLTPYTSNEEAGPISFTLLLWIAQLDREGILIYTPDLLNETDELFRSFHSLRTILFDDAEKGTTRTSEEKKRGDSAERKTQILSFKLPREQEESSGKEGKV